LINFISYSKGVWSYVARNLSRPLHLSSAERRAVTVSTTLNEEVVLSAGVTAGEHVIVDAPQGLADGSPIKEVKQ